MTNDQLLEKLYEGSLTPGERSLLDERVAESPEFAAEVQEFMAVVQLLDSEKQEERTDTAFLESTRGKVVALIAAAGAAGAGSAAVHSAGGLTSAAGSAMQWVVVGLTAVGLGGLAVWSVWDSPPETATKQPAAVVQEQSTPAEKKPEAPQEQSAAVVPSVAETAESVPIQNQQTLSPHTLAQQTPSQQRQALSDNTASVPDESTDKEFAASERDSEESDGLMNNTDREEDYRKMLQHYTQRLEENRIKKDIRGQAQALASIADVERLMKRYGSARAHAEESIVLWKQSNNISEQAAVYRMLGVIQRENDRLSAALDALNQGLSLVEGGSYDQIRGLLLGELAKVYIAQNNKKLAFEKMYACVVLLRRTNHPDLAVWERSLQELETSMK